MPETAEKVHGTSTSPSDNFRADLHLHTAYSDGANTPLELVDKVRAVGLFTISITDHDHVGGLDEAIKYGRSTGVEVIPGLELSAAMGEKDVHILAYFIDHRNRDLLDYLTFFRHERLKRAERIVEKLNKINIPITFESVQEQAGIGSLGRPHIASAMMEEGLIDSYHEAFTKYIGVGGPAYEKKFQLSPEEAIRLISAAGGLSFLAHPGKYTSEVELALLIKAGLDGIEVVHPSHNEARQEHYRGVVSQYFLLESGGSDYHGGRRNDDAALGAFWVPIQVVNAMKKRLFS
jgi:predicted metal-dependent phosphoesterase TrpH